MNVKTPPTPPIIPSQIIDEITPGPNCAANHELNAENASSITVWKGKHGRAN